MKTKRKLELKEKGWSEEAIYHAQHALEHTREHDVHFSKIIFWSALVVIVFANLIVSLVLVPFLIAFTPTFLYAIVILLAGTIGFLYNFLIKDIGHLNKHHHQIASVIIPIIAVGNIIMMVLMANTFTEQFATPAYNPWFIGILFGIAFLIPYIIAVLRGHHTDT